MKQRGERKNCKIETSTIEYIKLITLRFHAAVEFFIFYFSADDNDVKLQIHSKTFLFYL